MHLIFQTPVAHYLAFWTCHFKKLRISPSLILMTFALSLGMKAPALQGQWWTHCQSWVPKLILHLQRRLSLKQRQMSHWWGFRNRTCFGRNSLNLHHPPNQKLNCWLCLWCSKSRWGHRPRIRITRMRRKPLHVNFRSMLLGFTKNIPKWILYIS